MQWIPPKDPPESTAPPGAAQGIILAILLSSILWVGLAISVWMPW